MVARRISGLSGLLARTGALASALALAGLLAPASSAQATLYTLAGGSPEGQFGSAVASAGDVDDDGFPDILVGALTDDTNGLDAGAAFVYSGATGGLLLSWFGEALGDGLGSSVAGAGDIDGDGHDDLLVGEYRHDGVGANSGRAFLYSGDGGGVLFTLDGTGEDDEFGIGVAAIGDVDGDDVPDVAVGAHHDDDAGPNSGSVRLVSGATGLQIHLFTGASGDDMGHVLTGVGDVDGDTVPDIMIGLHDNAQPGQARVYSGGDQSLLFTFNGASNSDFFGHAVAGPGDIDGDGVPDLLLGATNDDAAGTDAGRAWLRSGATGLILFSWLGDSPLDRLGANVAGAGDWNGDGVRDVLLGMPGDDPAGSGSGAARFLSGADGSVLLTFDGDSPGQRVDVTVADLGDVNGDGRPDVAIGFPYHDLAALDAGITLVLSGALPTWSQLGGGIAGVAGVPSLAGHGLLIGGAPGGLHLKSAAPLAPAVLFVSLASLPAPFKGGLLGAFPPIILVTLATGAGGGLDLPWAAWPTGVPAATVLYFQVAVGDGAAVNGASLSNLLSGTTP